MLELRSNQLSLIQWAVTPIKQWTGCTWYTMVAEVTVLPVPGGPWIRLSGCCSTRCTASACMGAHQRAATVGDAASWVSHPAVQLHCMGSSSCFIPIAKEHPPTHHPSIDWNISTRANRSAARQSVRVAAATQSPVKPTAPALNHPPGSG